MLDVENNSVLSFIPTVGEGVAGVPVGEDAKGDPVVGSLCGDGGVGAGVIGGFPSKH